MGYIYGVKYIGNKHNLGERSQTLLSSKYCYIGQAVEYERRWNQERREIIYGNSNTPFYDTIRHYGIEKFIWEVLLIVDDNIMGLVEDEYIKKHSLYPNGLNFKGGGQHGKLTEELRNKLSIVHKERFKNVEVRERNRISQIKARQNNPELREKDRQTQLKYNATEAGKLKAKKHSDYMKSNTPERRDAILRSIETKLKNNKTEEGKIRISNQEEKRTEWRKSEEGLKWREEQSIRAKKEIERRRLLIPKRRCDICDYEPPNNSKPKLDRHLATQKHKNNEKNSI